MTNVLKPFFDIVNYIVMETDVPIEVRICGHESGNTLIAWHIGSSFNPVAGNHNDTLNTDNLDGDKLDRWVAELNALAYPCQHCGGSNLKLDTDCDEQWCLDCDDWAYIGVSVDEQSQSEIHASENAAFDKGERR